MASAIGCPMATFRPPKCSSTTRVENTSEMRCLQNIEFNIANQLRAKLIANIFSNIYTNIAVVFGKKLSFYETQFFTKNTESTEVFCVKSEISGGRIGKKY